jgi:hypothetical protein
VSQNQEEVVDADHAVAIEIGWVTEGLDAWKIPLCSRGSLDNGSFIEDPPGSPAASISYFSSRAIGIRGRGG